MARYAEVVAVQVYRPQHTISTASKPTTAQVETLLDNLSARVDGVLARLGFTTPISSVTSPAAFAYLKAAVAVGVAGQIEDGQRAGISSTDDSRVRSHYWQDYVDLMRAVEEQPGILTDAVRTTVAADKGGRGEPVIESFFTNNPTDDLESGQTGLLEGSAVPRFRVSQEF